MSTSDTPPQHRDLGAILVGLGALLLFISLFLHWYEPGRSAWKVFEVWDLVLAGLAVAGVLGALARLGLVEARWERWMGPAGALSFVIVVISLVNHPPAADGAGTMIGIWLALAATVVMLAGVAIARARISLVIELTDRMAPREAGAGFGLGAWRRHRRTRPPATPVSDPMAPPPASSPPATPPSVPEADPAADEQPTRPHIQDPPAAGEADPEP